MKNLKIGIIVADVDEYKPFEKFIKSNEYSDYNFLGRTADTFKIFTDNSVAEVITILCGIGKVNAAAAAMHLVDVGCDYIFNYGLSGGISKISRGEITAPNMFLEHDFDLTGIGYKLCEKPSQEYIYYADKNLLKFANKVIKGVKFGTAVSGDHFICDSQKREVLAGSFNAMSCDMETAAIAYVCNFSKVPFLSLRRISDDAANNATESYRDMNSQNDTLLSDYLVLIIKELL